MARVANRFASLEVEVEISDEIVPDPEAISREWVQKIFKAAHVDVPRPCLSFCNGDTSTPSHDVARRQGRNADA